MASEAQIRANQQNAQKSSGPTSVEGKKKSSMNAVTHGIFSNIAILPGEDEALKEIYSPKSFHSENVIFNLRYLF